MGDIVEDLARPTIRVLVVRQRVGLEVEGNVAARVLPVVEDVGDTVEDLPVVGYANN